VESFVGGASVWAALADAMHGVELGEGAEDLPMGTADYQIMPDLVASGEFCAGIIDPTQAIPYLADERVKTLYDGKAGSELYAENFMPGHEGMTSNNFIALLAWYEDHPRSVAFFLEVWQRAMDEWTANRELIIDTYPQHFAADNEDQVQFIKDYFETTFDWFVDSPYLDDAWIEGEMPITDILKEANLVREDLDFPTHVCIDPATGEETCRYP
jgi:hypothetical protein